MASEQQWERLAEHPGGVITALATAQDAEQGMLLFAGSAAGLQSSMDGGRTWMSLSDESNLSLVTSLAPSPSFALDSTIFIGTANGCYRSADRGRTYQPVLTGGQIFAVATVPQAAPTPAVPGVVFAGTEADGVFRSNDGGQTWSTVNAGLLDLTILALAFSPDFARDRTGFVATASGLYCTHNGGKAWRWVDLGLDEAAVQCLAISSRFGPGGLVFAGTEDDGLLRSDDTGATWELVEGVAGRSVTAVAIAADDRLIAVATDHGIVVTADGGATWRRQGEGLGPVLCLAFVPSEGREVLVAGLVGEGIARSENNGADWVRVNQGFASDAGARPDSGPRRKPFLTAHRRRYDGVSSRFRWTPPAPPTMEHVEGAGSTSASGQRGGRLRQRANAPTRWS